MRVAKLLTLALLAFSLFGCKNDVPKYGGTQRPVFYGSIISLSPGATELIMAGNSRGFRGRTASCDYPPSVQSLPIVFSGTKPDYEMIAEIKPDLIVYDADLFNEADLEQLKEMNVETYPIGGKTIDDFILEIYKFGTKIGGESMLSKYADKIKIARDVSQAEAPNPKPKVAIMMSGEGTEHLIAGVNSFQADVVRAAGGEPIGPDADRFVPLNAESFFELDPDAILTAGPLGSLQDDARFKSLTAFTDGNLFQVDPDLMLRRGARVDALIKAIHQVLEGMN